MASNFVRFYGKKLAEARRKKGFTQEKLAVLIKATQEEISEYENEKRGCYIKRANSIIELLDSEYDELIRPEMEDYIDFINKEKKANLLEKLRRQSNKIGQLFYRNILVLSNKLSSLLNLKINILLSAITLITFSAIYYNIYKNKTLLERGVYQEGIDLINNGKYKLAHDFFTELKEDYPDNSSEIEEYLNQIYLKRLKVAYVQDHAIYIMSADSSNKRLIDGGSNPVWSYDGNYLAYTDYHIQTDDYFDLYLYDLYSNKRLKICSDLVMESKIHWSPDNKSVLILLDRLTVDLILVDIDGKQTEFISEIADEFLRVYNEKDNSISLYPEVLKVKWSQDNRHLALLVKIMENEKKGYQILHIDVKDKTFSIIRKSYYSYSIPNIDFFWTKDNNLIYLLEMYPTIYSLFNYNINTRTTQVYEIAINNNFDYSIVNNSITYSSSDGDYEIHTMNLDEKKPKKLTSNLIEDINPIWSHDGKMIIFFSDQQGFYDVYIIDEGGNGRKKIANFNANFGSEIQRLPGISKIYFSPHSNNPAFIVDIYTGWTKEILNNVNPVFSTVLIDEEPDIKK